ncbi:MAG TPA: phosphoenolpyruvate carboxykinase (ATP) [Puia sp.]|nr:phosphoenolpyruvate carboxykinase (ATP) [Puia sp.]
MSSPSIALPPLKLLRLGLKSTDFIHYQETPAKLIRESIRRSQGQLCDLEALVISTGKYTGRCPKDRFIVRDVVTAESVNWNEVNQPLDEAYFDVIFKRSIEHLNKLSDIWVRDAQACADPSFRMNIRVITESPSMNLFAHNMFIRPTEDELEDFEPGWHIISVPGLSLNPAECGIRNSNATVISFKRKMVLISGSGYTGELKKAIFSVLNFVLPNDYGVLSMHCSANEGRDGNTALFFGLSGTGKTTLSADPQRKLIGDDEHGWSDEGIFNFEGGCYAKCINLSENKEPDIYHAIRFGSMVENVTFYPATNRINFDDSSITENTRVSYPLNFISNALEPSVADAPENIFLLTCDAYGVLPPVSRLTVGQAMYQFISGYTAKIAGTESGINEPKPTFSACFGAPFMPLHPGRYASMFGDRVRKGSVRVWFINTGWSGGIYGKGNRIKLNYTRAIVSAVLSGQLDHADYEQFPLFNFSIPTSCPGVPNEILNPANTWGNKEAYRMQALKLAGLFASNFKQYAEGVTKDVLDAAPVF